MNNLKCRCNLFLFAGLLSPLFVSAQTVSEDDAEYPIEQEILIEDPLESINRGVFFVNDSLDRYVLKPVARQYLKLPDGLRSGVSNVFDNLGEVGGGVNHFLQGQFAQSGTNFARFGVNSTLGVFGVFDVASHMGLKAKGTDFGLTMARYGVGEGIYIVPPLMPSGSVRDVGGQLIDLTLDPLVYYSNVNVRNVAVATNLINERSKILYAEQMIDLGLTDRYSLIKDISVRKRRFEVEREMEVWEMPGAYSDPLAVHASFGLWGADPSVVNAGLKLQKADPILPRWDESNTP